MVYLDTDMGEWRPLLEFKTRTRVVTAGQTDRQMDGRTDKIAQVIAVNLRLRFRARVKNILIKSLPETKESISSHA